MFILGNISIKWSPNRSILLFGSHLVCFIQRCIKKTGGVKFEVVEVRVKIFFFMSGFEIVPQLTTT
jgi:hypothetical protein